MNFMNALNSLQSSEADEEKTMSELQKMFEQLSNNPELKKLAASLEQQVPIESTGAPSTSSPSMGSSIDDAVKMLSEGKLNV